MKTNTKAVGERTEGFILARLLQLGHSVSMPFGDNQRYDMILDEDGKLYRCQCKTGRVFKNAVTFSVCSNNWLSGERYDYHGQIELFLVYCPQLQKFYRVPVEICGKKEFRLRIYMSATDKLRGYRAASDFEF